MSQEMRNKERDRRSKEVPIFEKQFIQQLYKLDNNGHKVIIDEAKWMDVAMEFKTVIFKSKLRYRK